LLLRGVEAHDHTTKAEFDSLLERIYEAAFKKIPSSAKTG
jgi:hypothetical protein